jgi:ACR3 family arsenite efflux pump ArsB
MKPISLIILIYAIFATLGLYLIENMLHPTYGVQMIQKIVLFLVIPVSMGYFSREKLGVF